MHKLLYEVQSHYIDIGQIFFRLIEVSEPLKDGNTKFTISITYKMLIFKKTVIVRLKE